MLSLALVESEKRRNLKSQVFHYQTSKKWATYKIKVRAKTMAATTSPRNSLLFIYSHLVLSCLDYLHVKIAAQDGYFIPFMAL